MMETVTRIEDFLPAALRDDILAFEKTAFGENPFNYAVRSVRLPEALKDRVLDQLRIHGVPLDSPGDFWLRVETSAGIHDENAFIHIDPQDTTAIVVYIENSLYLKPEKSGTSFWKHRGLGKSSVDRGNPRDVLLYNTVLRTDGRAKEKWEVWLEVPFTENLAVVFRTNTFHSAPHPSEERAGSGKRISLSLFLK